MKLLLHTAALTFTLAIVTTAWGVQEETFLGVSTHKASKTIRSQLNIPEGVGVIVSSVVKESPADGKLMENDILTVIEDQLLINPEQLGVLIKSYNPGDSVKVEYIRKGKESSQEIVLDKREKNDVSPLGLPSNIQILGPTIKAFTLTEDVTLANEALDPKAINNLIMEELSKLDISEFNMTPEQISNMIKGIDIDIDSIMDQPSAGNTISSSAISSSVISSIIVDKETGATLNYTASGNDVTLKIIDKEGKVVFDGPVSTDEQKIKIPEEYRKAFDELLKINVEPWGDSSEIIKSLGIGSNPQ